MNNVALNDHEKKNELNTWLNEFASNVTSQCGEDGIISKVLEVINDNDKWCVEFGSWNGKNYSNTYDLISEKDYSAKIVVVGKDQKNEFARLINPWYRDLSLKARL